MPQPALMSLMRLDMMKGMMHSMTTSIATRMGVAMDSFLYSRMLFASCFTIFLFLCSFLTKKRRSSAQPGDLRDEHRSLSCFMMTSQGNRGRQRAGCRIFATGTCRQTTALLHVSFYLSSSGRGFDVDFLPV